MQIKPLHESEIFDSALWLFEKMSNHHNQPVSIDEIEETLKEIYEMGYDQGVEDTEDENG